MSQSKKLKTETFLNNSNSNKLNKAAKKKAYAFIF